ncbi:MAG TPA: helix-turn-helix domain-containing protein, partial [Aequorivita sp.]|nr:helix-turn-helix domain-containing protein [Aequorivita sp.]
METELKMEKIISLLENNNLQHKEILSFQEAIAYLDVSKSFLYKLTSSNNITFFKPSGKLIYFKKSDLDQWILRNESPALESL